MNKWLELASLIPKGLANIDKVAEGIYNDLKVRKGHMSESELQEITKRRLICAGCEYCSVNAIAAGTYQSERTDPHCIQCECKLDWKTACLTCNCGIEDYNEQNPDTPMALKWEAFKPGTNEETKP